MPTTLSTFRSWLRLDLSDPAGPEQRFADAGLDRAVARALADLTLVAPPEIDTEHTCVAASRTLDLSGAPYADQLLDVVEVELPYGSNGDEAAYPPRLVPFQLSPDRTKLTLRSAAVPAAGQVLRLRWAVRHAVSEVTSTVPVAWEAMVAAGAAGYAMLAYSTPSADNFKYDDGMAASGVDDSMIPREWRARAEATLARWSSWLATLRRQRALSGSPWVRWEW
jgi:hypothetical protein